MQFLIETCDRCKEEVDCALTDVRVHFGGNNPGHTWVFDLCPECRDDLRVFLNTRP